jgi:hypothetical protein
MTDATQIEPFELDAHEVAPGLWQGAVPPEGHAVAEAGFSMLVLCAEEYQFQADCFPGVRVVHAPNDDADALSPQQIETAQEAAQAVARELARGGTILVTCAAGLNRSGLVNGLALVLHGGRSVDAAEVVRRIQLRRPWALCNPYFVELIHEAARRWR